MNRVLEILQNAPKKFTVYDSLAHDYAEIKEITDKSITLVSKFDGTTKTYGEGNPNLDSLFLNSNVDTWNNWQMIAFNCGDIIKANGVVGIITYKDEANNSFTIRVDNEGGEIKVDMHDTEFASSQERFIFSKSIFENAIEYKTRCNEESCVSDAEFNEILSIIKGIVLSSFNLCINDKFEVIGFNGDGILVNLPSYYRPDLDALNLFNENVKKINTPHNNIFEKITIECNSDRLMIRIK